MELLTNLKMYDIVTDAERITDFRPDEYDISGLRFKKEEVFPGKDKTSFIVKLVGITANIVLNVTRSHGGSVVTYASLYGMHHRPNQYSYVSQMDWNEFLQRPVAIYMQGL